MFGNYAKCSLVASGHLTLTEVNLVHVLKIPTSDAWSYYIERVLLLGHALSPFVLEYAIRKLEENLKGLELNVLNEGLV
jgi:hypothetical protein